MCASALSVLSFSRQLRLPLVWLEPTVFAILLLRRLLGKVRFSLFLCIIYLHLIIVSLALKAHAENASVAATKMYVFRVEWFRQHARGTQMIFHTPPPSSNMHAFIERAHTDTQRRARGAASSTLSSKKAKL